MSDLVIPGTGSSNCNTKEIIELSMQRERIPLGRMTAAQDRAKVQREVWQDMNRLLTQLRDSAAGLYGFQNPFQNKIAVSGDEGSFTATATGEAGIDPQTVRVESNATADSLLSRSVDRTYR